MWCEKFIPGCMGCICSSAAEMSVLVFKAPMNTAETALRNSCYSHSGKVLETVQVQGRLQEQHQEPTPLSGLAK